MELSYSRIECVTDEEDVYHLTIHNAVKLLDMHEFRLIYEVDLLARSGL